MLLTIVLNTETGPVDVEWLVHRPEEQMQDLAFYIPWPAVLSMTMTRMPGDEAVTFEQFNRAISTLPCDRRSIP